MLDQEHHTNKAIVMAKCSSLFKGSREKGTSFPLKKFSVIKENLKAVKYAQFYSKTMAQTLFIRIFISTVLE